MLSILDESTGKVASCEYVPNNLVSDLKGVVQAYFDIDSNDITLKVSGIELKDASTLLSASITPQSLVTVHRKHTHFNNINGMDRNMAQIEQFLRESGLTAPELLQSAMNIPHITRRMSKGSLIQASIDSNYANALELNPEGFGRVVLLYVDIRVNDTPFKALVDTGAQMTIMSESAARKAGLIDLVDRRFRGVAVGVGSAPIIGRIHVTKVKVGGSVLMCSFTILSTTDSNGGSSSGGGTAGIDIIIGLDTLMKHECVINLKDSVLQVADTVVPFLQEKDLPTHARG
eukprot:GHVR01050004.1.p1 GENE.GHVR01050004.1~~GHVR01050004.1.p1  ORF type:complete len:295 (-),score=64.82 GHVR01050004.1:97-960(-)